MRYVLATNSTSATGRRLVTLLNELDEWDWRYTTKLRRRGPNVEALVRWGSTANIPQERRGNGQVLNLAVPVGIARDKLGALRQMFHTGVPVPEATTLPETVQEWYDEDEDLIIFGRKFHHSQGRDIRLYGQTIKLDVDFGADGRSDYYVKYVRPHKEYRVHVFKGEILFAQKKYYSQALYDRMSGALPNGNLQEKLFEEKDFIRNNAHGWRFYDVEDVNTVPLNVRNASIRAVDALGLTFGAVDVISTTRGEDGRRGACVLEINTGPGLRDRNLARYATAIIRYLNGITPN